MCRLNEAWYHDNCCGDVVCAIYHVAHEVCRRWAALSPTKEDSGQDRDFLVIHIGPDLRLTRIFGVPPQKLIEVRHVVSQRRYEGFSELFDFLLREDTAVFSPSEDAFGFLGLGGLVWTGFCARFALISSEEGLGFFDNCLGFSAWEVFELVWMDEGLGVIDETVDFLPFSGGTPVVFFEVLSGLLRGPWRGLKIRETIWNRLICF